MERDERLSGDEWGGLFFCLFIILFLKVIFFFFLIIYFLCLLIYLFIYFWAITDNACMHEEKGKLVKSALWVKINVIFPLSMFVNIA